MTLADVATIRTGIVTSRKDAKGQPAAAHYKLLNLKCVTPEGTIDSQYAENFSAVEELNPTFLTKMGDILVRLSTPYTAILISKAEWCGYLVPSHFAIIRVIEDMAAPEYIFWILTRNSTKQQILKESSGASAFATIHSGFFNTLKIRALPVPKQKILGQLQLLSVREQELMKQLAEQKERYNRILIKQIYDSVKRGNKI